MNERTDFRTSHSVLLLKYGGIAFVSGAVNHGFFSGTRSLITAVVGVTLYLLGAWLELRRRPAEERRWGEMLGAGVLLAIGLGLFTGGLQHFPDSPERSAWVVPLGFAMSAAALYWSDASLRVHRAAVFRYASLAGVVVITGSVAGLLALQGTGIGAAGDDHAHDHGSPPSHSHASAGAPAAAPAGPVWRTVEIRMDDSMRFSPSIWQARAGEVVLIKVHNAGKLPHELVLGTEAQLEEHAAAMRANPGPMHHGHANAIHLSPGASGELRWTVPATGQIGMACFEPGHYEAGMKGKVDVKS